MALLQRAILAYVCVLAFLILVAVRLDQRLEWNWFLVFIPLWLFDFVVLVLLVIKMISHCRFGYDQSDMSLSMINKVWFVGVTVLTLTFQIMLCVRLQARQNSLKSWVNVVNLLYDNAG
ncbi:transmembrane protein 60-like [Acanthaster planci]|uniref:Transmembrane protein 60-like n=1 Tax=Acanthaster planci TaxID=133434 RepID=A0A8B7ZAT7_ACAPL|nr:transmembrane protein 60-like [Acanthaster planci]